MTEQLAPSALARGDRQELPTRRAHDSWRFQIETITYTAGVGRIEEGGAVVELWLNAGKVGSSLEALANDAAIMASLLLQYGCPIDEIRNALTRNSDKTAAGPIGVLLDQIAKGESER